MAHIKSLSLAAGRFAGDNYTPPNSRVGFIIIRLQDAKGDQCDKCGSMLNPTELINPRCKITGTTPVLRKTKHLFLDLPKLTPELQAYITKTSELGGWSANCVAVRGGGPPYFPSGAESCSVAETFSLQNQTNAMGERINAVVVHVNDLVIGQLVCRQLASGCEDGGTLGTVLEKPRRC